MVSMTASSLSAGLTGLRVRVSPGFVQAKVGDDSGLVRGFICSTCALAKMKKMSKS